MRLAIFLFALLLCGPTYAEIYMGIKPHSNLGDIKKMFPNAVLFKVKAAWVTESDGFFSMTGQGLSGTIYLAFRDRRSYSRQRADAMATQLEEARKLPPSVDNTARQTTLQDMSSLFGKWAAETDDEALVISWVRWVPGTPIPLARYVTKYGIPTKTGFADADMRPYNSWPSKGVLLTLTDDGKYVALADFHFTAAESKAECLARYKDPLVCN